MIGFIVMILVLSWVHNQYEDVHLHEVVGHYVDLGT